MAEVMLEDVVREVVAETDAKQQAACACIRVAYRPREHTERSPHPITTYSERWFCTDCGREFVKRPPEPPPSPQHLPLELPPTKDVPAGMRTVMWIPVEGGAGLYFQCYVEGFGVRGSGLSRHKLQALSYALEDMAKQVAALESDR